MKGHSDDEILGLLSKPATYEQGFRLLMSKYQKRVYWHIRRMVTDHEDANDVVQNTFVKVFRGLEKFNRQSKLYTWLYRIATNETLTFLNNRKRRLTATIDDDENQLGDKLEADSYFDGDLAQKKLMLALDRLPDKQRAVFSLRYFDEMPYSEISEILGTSIGALKASYHHAVKKIEVALLNTEV